MSDDAVFVGGSGGGGIVLVEVAAAAAPAPADTAQPCSSLLEFSISCKPSRTKRFSLPHVALRRRRKGSKDHQNGLRV